MSEVVKDSAIKLFGTTISLPRNNEVSATAYGSSSEPPPPEDCSDHCPPSSSSSPREVSSTREHAAETDKEAWREELTSAQDEEASHQSREELKSPTSSSGILENPKTPSTERETCLLKSSKVREQSDTKEEKGGKKPEKIIACPRCKSMDTKFCYYNNYNVNQPRHFCKNCLRYWTAGGTMRNVPVGAGRRKNKNSCSSASHYRQIMVPETLQTPNGSLHSAVLTFGSNSPLSDSIASVFDLAEKSQSGVLNGFHSPTKQNNNNNDKNNKNNNNDNGDDDSIGASVMKASTPKRDNATSCSHEESVDRSYQAFTPQLCFQGSSSPPSSSWSYPWNAAMSTPSAFCQQSYHRVPLYPTPALWRCMPPSWSVHSISPKSCVNYQSATSCGPNSRTLGKHSRDGNILFQTNSQKEKPAGSESSNNTENNSTSRVLLIPKTLRIDDPTEAAKSSIWSTLGIKNENENGNSGGGGLFNAFAYKGGELGDEKNHVMVEASSVLQANPAALTRSLIFHERT